MTTEDRMQKPENQKVVSAERFELVDSNGNFRAALDITEPGQPRLKLYGKNNEVRREIRFGPDGRAIWQVP